MAFDNLRVKESESYRLDWFLNTQGLENEGEEAWHGTWLASPKPETLKEKIVGIICQAPNTVCFSDM